MTLAEHEEAMEELHIHMANAHATDTAQLGREVLNLRSRVVNYHSVVEEALFLNNIGMHEEVRKLLENLT